MVRITNLVAVREPDREEKIPAPPEKFQHNSGFLDGPWPSWDDPGAGGVVRDSLGGLEDGRDLFDGRSGSVRECGSRLGGKRKNSPVEKKRIVFSGFCSQTLVRSERWGAARGEGGCLVGRW